MYGSKTCSQHQPGAVNREIQGTGLIQDNFLPFTGPAGVTDRNAVTGEWEGDRNPVSVAKSITKGGGGTLNPPSTGRNSSSLQINTKFRIAFLRKVHWPPGRALLWILNSSHMQCVFPAQVENRLSSSSAALTLTLSRETQRLEIGGWIQSLRAKEGLTLHYSLVWVWWGAVTISSSFQKTDFKRSWQDRYWVSQGSPDLLLLEPGTVKCPVAQSQAETYKSYSVKPGPL